MTIRGEELLLRIADCYSKGMTSTQIADFLEIQETKIETAFDQLALSYSFTYLDSDMKNKIITDANLTI